MVPEDSRGGAGRDGTSERDGPDELRLAMLGGFRLLDHDTQVALAPGSARLLAFLALAGRSVNRLVVATHLWPDAAESHAYGSLRAALGRLPGPGRDALLVRPSELGLSRYVRVDLVDARALAHRLLDPGVPPTPADLTLSAISMLSCDLLCDWYDDWAIFEAEDWRQLRLHALEALACHLSRAERFGHAAMAARAAVRADPLRESAHVALIRVHLAEGNQSEARRVRDGYRALLKAELGLEPSHRLDQLAGM